MMKYREICECNKGIFGTKKEDAIIYTHDDGTESLEINGKIAECENRQIYNVEGIYYFHGVYFFRKNGKYTMAMDGNIIKDKDFKIENVYSIDYCGYSQECQKDLIFIYKKHEKDKNNTLSIRI